MRNAPSDINEYAALFTSHPPAYLEELETETWANVPVPNMISGHVQGRLLTTLSKLISPRRILELGTYTGYSALCLAEGLSTDGELHTIEHHERLIPLARRYFDKSPFGERIHLHHGDIAEVLNSISGPFQLVFIDADKPNYDKYFDMVFDRIDTGGLIIADNIFWKGRVLEPENNNNAQTRGMIRYAEKVKKDDRLESVFLPMNDGLLLSRKK
jgi:predicted O-methyltransferase YrrM